MDNNMAKVYLLIIRVTKKRLNGKKERNNDVFYIYNNL